MMPLHRAYIGLGSNLSEPIQQIKTALLAFNDLEGSKLITQSGLYTSAPMGPQDQPDYVNAVALISTSLASLDLLDKLQAMELSHQRKRKRHWGPRTLDLDLLLYDNQSIDHERLQVPHVGLTERHFVLYPLAEIAPKLVLPNGKTLSHYLQKCPIAELTKLDV